MEKRKQFEVQKFGCTSSGHLLLYFEDGGYEIIHSSSALLPSSVKYEFITEKDVITLRPGYDAKVLMKSNCVKDLEVYQRRLSNQLDKEKMPLDSSFTFLNSSEPQTSFNESHESHDNLSKEPSVLIEHKPDEETSSTESEPDKKEKNDVILRELKKMSKRISKMTKNQDKMIRDLRIIKKNMKKKEEPEMKETVSAVMFEGVDVANIGQNNMDPSHFGVCLARQLFTDEELKEKMLFPKRASSRPPLSPNRSGVFRLAIESRFSPEALDEACRAVNCLGNDLKKGRRWRKTFAMKFSEEKSEEHGIDL